MASLNANVANAAPPRDFTPMPVADYLAQIIESDVVPTQAGTGRILKLTFEIIEGPFANRRVWENLNIENPNIQTQEIAQGMLKSICDAIGHNGDVQDSEELHGQPMIVRLKIVKDKTGQYPDKNGIGGAKSIATAQQGQQRTAPPPQQQARPATAPPRPAPAAGGPGARPWNRPTG